MCLKWVTQHWSECCKSLGKCHGISHCLQNCNSVDFTLPSTDGSGLTSCFCHSVLESVGMELVCHLQIVFNFIGFSFFSTEPRDWLDVYSFCFEMSLKSLNTHTHTHPFNGPFSWTTQMSRYQKGNTNLDFTEASDSEWQWHQLGHMQVCISLQTDNHASTPPLKFFTGRIPFLPPNQQRQSTEGK